jgi:hypothetical protein
VCPRCWPPLLTNVSAMRIARRCRRCAARAVVAVDARADTDANCASHRVLQHVDNSLAVDNVAQASVLLAQFGVSFDPFGGAKSRVTVSAYSAPRLAEARQRPARAALGACCHRCVGGAHVLDDRFGRRRRLGRAVVRRSAPDAHWLRSPARRSAQRCAQATLQDVVDARILDARTLVDPIVDLLAANRARSREGACRACRRRAAHADAAGGHAGHHAAHATPAAADDGLHARRQV